jgi:N-glycosidase YbiA
MVVSVIDSKINYPEIKTIDSDDLQHDASLYETDINGNNVIIALGKEKFTYTKDNIVYFPIYLVKGEKVSSQIGLYETRLDKLPDVIDSDGDLDLEAFGSPLIYSFVTPEMLAEAAVEDEDDSEEDEDDSEEDEEDELGEPEEIDVESLKPKSKEEEKEELVVVNVKGFKGPAPLPQQTADKAEEERGQPTQKNSWIASFMNNANYSIQDNEGGGDCLFAVIRDGLAGAGKATNVSKLRNALAKEVTEDIFSNYKAHYEMYKGALITATEELKKIAEDQKKLKYRLRQEKDRSLQAAIVQQGKENEKRFHRLKIERAATSNMYKEYKYMEKIDNVEAFKTIIKTCNFWGETWAISTLERVLNIKFILLSRENYREGDSDNVMQCGQLNDLILQNRGSFEPSHYIVIDYNGSHFQLIKYKRRGIFTFKELPYDLKQLVVEKCLEGESGPYSLIPDFQKLNEEANKGKVGKSASDPGDDLHNQYYDPEIVFQFYSKSSDKPYPGKGAGEKIQEKDIKNFTALSEIKGWRKMLSNFFVSPFELDGRQWNSVEHYYQAAKFKKTNPEFYTSFSLDKPSNLSKDPRLAKAAGGKSGKTKIDGKIVELRAKGIEADLDFFGKRKNEEMMRAQFAKFTQNPVLKDMLLKTRDAKLTHHVRGSPAVVFTELMKIRKKINSPI